MKSISSETLATDFGLYGEYYIWESTPDELNSSGTICKDESRIKIYEKFFHRLWENASDYSRIEKEIEKLCKGKKITDFKNILG